MKVSRRDFLKVGCIGIGTLATVGSVGCSTGPSAGGSSAGREEKPGTDTVSTQQETATASKGAEATSASTAVIFFSCTGSTEAVADRIAQAASSTLMRIEAAEPYTEQDLDYNSDCRANAEQESGSARPAIANPIPNIAGFDTIYLGYPIWWGKAPRIILTFLEGVDTTGKRIVPFCTSGSSPISGSIDELHAAAPSAEWAEGRRFSRDVPQQDVDAWVEETR